MNETAVIINPDSSFSERAVSFFRKKGLDIYMPSKKGGMERMVLSCSTQGVNLFIVCGGDGTVNKFINAYMKIPISKREKIKVGFIPSGNANDFHTHMGISKSFNKAYNRILKGASRKIDLVKVNSSYFITGGAFGFPSDIVSDVDKLSKSDLGVSLKRLKMKDSLFLISAMSRFLKGYEGVKHKDSDDKFSLVSVCNQPFIGRLFKLSPRSKNDDGVFEVCKVPKRKTGVGDVLRASAILTGNHLGHKDVNFVSMKSFTFKTKRVTCFMADGEILENGKSFRFRIVPDAINVF
jgi:YegS/Rv2252/BmrU family lipid kinase